MSRPYTYLKEEVYEANMQLPKLGLVVYTFGNVSALDRKKGVVGIKPSGVPYEDLRPDDIVIIDLENNVVEGTMRPSSDTKTHLLLYQHFETIAGIAHTHSAHAVSWAQAKRAIPNYGTTHADHLVSEIPITEEMSPQMIEGDYEMETGHQILNLFKRLDYQEVEMVLVACHGPFTWGKTAAKAVYNSKVLEELAKMAWMTERINPNVRELSDALKKKHYERKHGKNAYYGQDATSKKNTTKH